MLQRPDPHRRRSRALRSALRSALTLGLALSFGLSLSGCAERFFFAADQRNYSAPQQFGLAAEDVWIDSPRGAEHPARMHAWWLPVPPGQAVQGTVLHLHGNGANVSNHLPLVAWLPAEGWQVLTLDYRGYGRSEGVATLEGVVADARAALDHLRTRLQRQRALDSAVPPGLVVLGQSLGGATAIRAVAEDPAEVRLLVVDSAFDSYRGITRELGDALGAPWSWLVQANSIALPGPAADPLQAITRLRVPVLLIHGSADAMIPIGHGERLHAAAPAPKGFIRVEGGQHIDALRRPAVREVLLQRMREQMQAGLAPNTRTAGTARTAPAAAAAAAAPAPR
jgi:hypothetical protein